MVPKTFVILPICLAVPAMFGLQDKHRTFEAVRSQYIKMDGTKGEPKVRKRDEAFIYPYFAIVDREGKELSLKAGGSGDPVAPWNTKLVKGEPKEDNSKFDTQSTGVSGMLIVKTKVQRLDAKGKAVGKAFNVEDVWTYQVGGDALQIRQRKILD